MLQHKLSGYRIGRLIGDVLDGTTPVMRKTGARIRVAELARTNRRFSVPCGSGGKISCSCRRDMWEGERKDGCMWERRELWVDAHWGGRGWHGGCDCLPAMWCADSDCDFADWAWPWPREREKESG